MKDGKIVADELKNKLNRSNLDTEKRVAFKKSIDKCSTFTDPDKCEGAANFAKCMHEEKENQKSNAN